MEKSKKFGGPFAANDKVQELKDVLEGNTPAHATDQNSTSPTSQEEELRLQIDDLTAKLAQSAQDTLTHKNELLRTIADFDNTRKRLKKESEELARFANEKLLSEFLPIIDSLEMSLTHSNPKEGSSNALIEGIELTLKQFLSTLEKFGLSSIEGLGQPFDPNTQEAIASVPAENIGEGCVALVHRKGYKLHNRVIRPAMVSIKL